MTDISRNSSQEVESYTIVQTVLGVGVFLSFMWLFINSIIIVASIIILLNVDGYEERTFVVSGHNYSNNSEDGLSWSLKGNIGGMPVRYADNALVNRENISASKLKRKFPVGTEMLVLYNPGVTDDLFQNRSVDVVSYTPDLVSAEKERAIYWIKRCLLPFLGFSLVLFVCSSKKPRLQN